MTENDDSKLRGILFWTSSALLGGGIMLGCMASKWPTECRV